MKSYWLCLSKVVTWLNLCFEKVALTLCDVALKKEIEKVGGTVTQEDTLADQKRDESRCIQELCGGRMTNAIEFSSSLISITLKSQTKHPLQS